MQNQRQEEPEVRMILLPKPTWESIMESAQKLKMDPMRLMAVAIDEYIARH